MNGTRGQNTCDGEYNATQTSRRCLRCQSTTTTTKVAKEKITTSEQDNVFFQTDWLSYSIATRKMFPLCVLLPFSSFNYFHVWVVAGCWDWVPHRVMRSRPRWFVHWTARQPVSLLPRRKSFHLFSIIIIIIQEKKQIHLISYHFIGYYYSDEKNGDIARRINWLVLADSQKMAKLAKFKFSSSFSTYLHHNSHIAGELISTFNQKKNKSIAVFFLLLCWRRRLSGSLTGGLRRRLYKHRHRQTDIDRQTCYLLRTQQGHGHNRKKNKKKEKKERKSSYRDVSHTMNYYLFLFSYISSYLIQNNSSQPIYSIRNRNHHLVNIAIYIYIN